MSIDLIKFYQVCDPSQSLNIADKQDEKYYIDFSAVRGGQVIEDVRDKIAIWSSDQPTCQLFTGHMGCGKSTELLKLKAQLEEKDFHVVYIETVRLLDMGDIDVTDILFAIARHTDENLRNIGIELEPKERFKEIINGIFKFFKNINVPIPGIGASLSLNIFNPLLKEAKNSPDLRSQIRQYSEPRTGNILEAINKELLEPAVEALKQKNKKGLVIIVDGLDKIERNRKPSGKTQPEYLFADRCEQLNKLNCHIVYTIPLELIFSKEIGLIGQKFSAYQVLPMIPIRFRDGKENAEGMELLRQMVMARAFPDENKTQQRIWIPEIFDNIKTLNRLCQVSGGHPRNLMILLRSWIEKRKTLPLTRETLEDVIREQKNKYSLAVLGDNDWKLLREVRKNKKIDEYEKYHQWLRNVFVLEYRDESGSWFDINPVLATAKELIQN